MCPAAPTISTRRDLRRVVHMAALWASAIAAGLTLSFHERASTVDPCPRLHPTGPDTQGAGQPLPLGCADPGSAGCLCRRRRLAGLETVGTIPGPGQCSGGDLCCSDGLRLALRRFRVANSDHRSSATHARADPAERRRTLSRGGGAALRPASRIQVRPTGRAAGNRAGSYSAGSRCLLTVCRGRGARGPRAQAGRCPTSSGSHEGAALGGNRGQLHRGRREADPGGRGVCRSTVRICWRVIQPGHHVGGRVRGAAAPA